ncbi:MAG: hypothetical protein R3B09_09890 [Nannocystaceae bacterium]
MPWYHPVAYFLAGAFAANFAPHFLAGVSGRAFPSPFATPPFRGLSSPVVNVLWGLVNLTAAYALLAGVGAFDPRPSADVVAAAAGFGLMSVALARKLGALMAARGPAH